MSLFNILNISGSALVAQSQRLNVSASNIANAESIINNNNNGEPYRAKHVIFKLDVKLGQQIGGVRVDQVIEDSAPWKLVYNPSHPLANDSGYIKMPNVNRIAEMVNILSASRSYQANLEVINNAKSMMIKTLAIGQ